MNPDGRTDGMDGRSQNNIPPTSSGDNKHAHLQTGRLTPIPSMDPHINTEVVILIETGVLNMPTD